MCDCSSGGAEHEPGARLADARYGSERGPGVWRRGHAERESGRRGRWNGRAGRGAGVGRGSGRGRSGHVAGALADARARRGRGRSGDADARLASATAPIAPADDLLVNTCVSTTNN